MMMKMMMIILISFYKDFDVRCFFQYTDCDSVLDSYIDVTSFQHELCSFT